MLGGIAGWQAERFLSLPALYTFPFPGEEVSVSVVWAAIGAFALCALGALLARPGHRSAARPRRR